MITQKKYSIQIPIKNAIKWQYLHNKLANKTAKSAFVLKFVSVVLMVLLTISSATLLAQETTDYNRFEVNISPRITLGYTFGAGVNCGVEIGASVYKFNDVTLGVNLNYCMIFIKNSGLHRISGAMLSAETQYIAGKIGIGKVNRSWGRRNVNKAGTYGLMIDAAACVDEYRAPWIGFKTFIFDRSKWPYYPLPTYTSAYTYFKSKNIEIYKQAPPKIVEEDDEE